MPFHSQSSWPWCRSRLGKEHQPQSHCGLGLGLSHESRTWGVAESLVSLPALSVLCGLPGQKEGKDTRFVEDKVWCPVGQHSPARSLGGDRLWGSRKLKSVRPHSPRAPSASVNPHPRSQQSTASPLVQTGRWMLSWDHFLAPECRRQGELGASGGPMHLAPLFLHAHAKEKL